MPPRIHLLDLPPEIHIKILLASLRASFDEDAEGSSHRPYVNLQTRLALVCRLWADLITSVTELWTQLSTDISDDSDEEIQMRLRRASNVLSEVEYSISMRIMAIGNHNVGPTANQAIIDFIARHIDRCQALDFRIPFGCWDMICEQGLEGAVAERLETLQIRASTAIEGDGDVFDLARRAPRLSSFMCDGIYMSMVNLPWNQLTSLDLRAVTIDECLSVLAQTTHLEHFSLVNIVIGAQPLTAPAVSMEHLKSFALCDHAAYGLVQLLHKLHAPSLEYFSWGSDVLANKPLTLQSVKTFMGGAAGLSTFVLMHDDPEALEGWVIDVWASALPLEVVVLKPNVLEFIRASALELGRRYCRYGTKEWDNVLLFLPSVLDTS